MRAALLITIVAGICMAAFVRPYLGLLGYLWFALLRPDILAWVEDRRLSFIIAVCVLLGSAIRLPAGIWRIWANPISRALVLLQVPIVLSALVAVDPSLSIPPLLLYLRVIIMALLCVVLFETREHLKYMLLVMAGSVGLLGWKYGLYGILAGGVWFAHGYGGMMADNNLLGLGLAMAVPLCWYAAQLVSYRWLKVIFWVMFLHTIAAVVMTLSRAAALGLGAGLFLIWWHSRRKLLVAFLLPLALFPALLLFSTEFVNRLSTLAAPEEEASALSRLVFWKAALKMWQDHPLLGVGFGQANQQELISEYVDPEWLVNVGREYHVLHNTYLQVLVDSGLFAFLIFCALMFGTLWWLGREVARLRVSDPAAVPYPAAIRAALAVFAVASTFHTRERFDFYYFLLMAAAVWYQVRFEVPASAPEASQAETGSVVSGGTATASSQPAPHSTDPFPARPGVGRGSSYEAWRRGR